LGPIQASVDLDTVAPTTKSNVHRYCPEHKARISQFYQCPDGEHVVGWGEWVLGAETAEGLKFVEEASKPEVARNDSLTLTPVPAKELNNTSLLGSTMYYCKPSTETAGQTWAILYRLLKGGKTALITRGALRKNSEKLWRVTLFRDYIVLREVLFPENIKDAPDPVDTKVDKATFGLVTQFVDGLMSSWDEFDTTDTMKAKTNEWLLKGTTFEAAEVKEEPTLDLTAALQMAIENQSS
jgi:non-homologous end joining protein Ku